ncbi:MAG: radical SAM protein [Rhodospirillaceae bacterium]|nr:radical SAM protein [Rhodospirillaceae bacterium]
MNNPPSHGYRKGRGAVTNVAGRYEATTTEAWDDGWGTIEEDLPPLRTTVQVDKTKTIIARNQSPDVGFDRSINPYRGCEHGCAYCFARPTHAYLGLSPGQDFESRLFMKPDAAKLLRAELSSSRYRCRVIAMGTNTDPYQPLERKERITRSVLEVLSAFDHPVGITTKSALVARDIDILGPMARERLAKVFISVTTLDRHLANRLEPRASTPARRLEAVKRLTDAGIPTGVMVAPIIPGLTDSEVEAIIAAAATAGAVSTGYVLLRLPLEIKSLFEEWLRENEPLKAAKVWSLMRQSRDGKLYDAAFGSRQRGSGAYATLIRQRVDAAAKRHGLNARPWSLDVTKFRVPTDQLSLF